MNRHESLGDLPEPVRRYFSEVADMEPPADLLESAIADIERSPRVERFAALPLLGFAAAAAVVIGIVVYGLLLPRPADVAVPSVSPQPSSPNSSASDSAEPSAAPDPDSLRVFDSEDITSLFPLDGDFEEASRTFFADGYPGETSAEGLVRRSSFGLTRDEGSTRYPFVFGGWVSVWTDAAAARAGLALSPWSQQVVIRPIELPAGGLGDRGQCAVVDWGTLADRGWCQFAVSNATVEMYIRTNTNGTELDPDAAADLAQLAVTMKERAEQLATGP